MSLLWIVLIIIGVVALIIFILALIGYYLDKSEEDGSFISRTVKNVRMGCSKILKKIRGC